MGVGAYHHIHLLLQKNFRPFFLKRIRIIRIFRAPMDKNQHRIRFLSGLLQVLPDLFFVL